MDLEILISQIRSLDGTLKQDANKAVNRLLAIRNWLIGYYIVEYEQNGADKAKYGDTLLDTLSASLNIKGLSVTNLKLNRLFYIAYPMIRQTLSDEFNKTELRIRETAPDEFEKNNLLVGRLLPGQTEYIDSPVVEKSKIKPNEFSNEAQFAAHIINRLSFSHITLLLPLDDPLKRTFYAIEAIKGTWSVRELKRQINSLLFERSGISKKPEQLLNGLNEKTEKEQQSTFVKDIYTFEFLGLQAKDAIEENDLETALLDHLQNFLLEMGHGFCLEARQKRILIGGEYFFIDMVFYHRVLKCHVLIDLKVGDFTHNNAWQLNTYINYYRKEVQLEGDNAPVGILLVANKNDALVEYAIAGMDEQLFVRKYLLELPDKNEIEKFIKSELKSL